MDKNIGSIWKSNFKKNHETNLYTKKKKTQNPQHPKNLFLVLASYPLLWNIWQSKILLPERNSDSLWSLLKWGLNI